MAVGATKEYVIGAINQRAEVNGKTPSLFCDLLAKEFLTTEKIVMDYTNGLPDAAPYRADIDDRLEGNLGDYKSQEYTPAIFSETIRLSRQRLAYNRAMGAQSSDLSSSARYVADSAALLVARERRGVEIMCRDAFIDGSIDDLKNQGDIDYGRDSASLEVSKSGDARWGESAADPLADLNDLAIKLLKHSGGGSVASKIICGENAIKLLLDDTKVKDLFDSVHTSQNVAERMFRHEASGAVFHGMLSAGSFKFSIYSYPAVIRESGSTTTDTLMPNNKVLMLPDRIPGGRLVYAGVPVVRADRLSGGILDAMSIAADIDFLRGEYSVQIVPDSQATSLQCIVESRVLPILPKPAINSVGVLTVA